MRDRATGEHEENVMVETQNTREPGPAATTFVKLLVEVAGAAGADREQTEGVESGLRRT